MAEDVIRLATKGQPDENAPTLTVTVKVFADGRRVVDSVDGNGSPGTIAQVRHALREAVSHYDDRFMATLAETAAKRLVSHAAQTKDRNGFFRFLHGLR